MVLQADTVLERKLVVLVDDNPDYQLIIGNLLRKAGYSIVSLHTGEESIGYVLTNSTKVGLVLMDTHLPRIQGYDAAREIRRYHTSTKLPIVGHSDLTDKNYLMQVWEGAGINGFLPKSDLTGKDAGYKIAPYFK